MWKLMHQVLGLAARLLYVRDGMNCGNENVPDNATQHPIILKQVGFLWNRTVAVDKLSSTSVVFIRSERELKKLHFYGIKQVH